MLTVDPPHTRPRACSVEESADSLTLAGAGYTLVVDRATPRARLLLNGRLVTDLQLGSACDPLDALDTGGVFAHAQLAREPDAVVLTWQGASACWRAKMIELRAWEDGFSYRYPPAGRGHRRPRALLPHPRRRVVCRGRTAVQPRAELRRGTLYRRPLPARQALHHVLAEPADRAHRVHRSRRVHDDQRREG